MTEDTKKFCDWAGNLIIDSLTPEKEKPFNRENLRRALNGEELLIPDSPEGREFLDIDD
jgi:hypothetical protein